MQFDFLMFPDAGFIAAVAHGNIAIIAAQHHLGTLGDDVAITDTGIHGGLGTAVAHGLDLLDAVSQFHQTHGAGEQLGLEIGTQTEAHDRHVVVIDDVAELIDLLREDCRLPLEKLAVMLGSTETTFYTISVYFGAAGIKKTRYTLPAALISDITGFIAAAFWTRAFFS